MSITFFNFFIFLFFPVLPCCYLYIIITFWFLSNMPFFLYNLTASTLTRFLHIFTYSFKPYSYKAFVFFILFFYFFSCFLFYSSKPTYTNTCSYFSFFFLLYNNKKIFFLFFFTSGFQNQLLWFLSLALLVCYFFCCLFSGVGNSVKTVLVKKYKKYEIFIDFFIFYAIL